MSVVCLILDNIRSTHNVGSIIRTANGFGVRQIITVGITPHFGLNDDERLPHVVAKAERQIKKTSLGAESSMSFCHFNQPAEVIAYCDKQNVPIIALEQDSTSVKIDKLDKSLDVALIVGNEVNGVSDEFLRFVETIVEIPMYGDKESFNVSVSTAIALYALLS